MAQETTDTGAILAIAMGCVFIAATFVIGQFHYAKSIMSISRSPRKAPLWAGRAMFMVVGIVFLIVGVAHFFTRR